MVRTLKGEANQVRDKAERRDERTLKKQRTWFNDETRDARTWFNDEIRDAIKTWVKEKSPKEAGKNQ